MMSPLLPIQHTATVSGEDRCTSHDERASSVEDFDTKASAGHDTGEERWSIPLRRRTHAYFGTTDSLVSSSPPTTPGCDGSCVMGRGSLNVRLDAGHANSWLRALSAHPVITLLAGIAHVVGIGRVASSLSAVSLTSLHSVDIDNFEEYDFSGGCDRPCETTATPCDSPFDYGFYVAITPPTTQSEPGSAMHKAADETNIGLFGGRRFPRSSL